MDTIQQAVEKVKAQFGPEVLAVTEHSHQVAISVRPAKILDILRMLRDDPELGFDYLLDICGVDYQGYEPPPAEQRFAVVYHLYSFKNNARLRVRAFLPEEKPEIDSAAPLWLAASWAEREAYDMYGITFKGHPDLRRILNPDMYEYFPLRKEYPLRGMGERENFVKYTE